MTTSPTSRPADSNEMLRRRLVAVLRAARNPLTTAELRDRANTHLAVPAHHECVYRNLLVLERRRQIRRQELTGRNVAWQILAPRPPLSARVPRRHPLAAPRDAASTTESRQSPGTASLTAKTKGRVNR